MQMKSLVVAFALFFAAPPIAAQQTPDGAGTAQVIAPYRIVGKVTDPQGNPVYAAEVVVVERDTAARRTRSDSAGRFVIDGIREAEIKLRVRRVGFQAQELTVRVTKAGRTANVSVRMEPSVASLERVVVDDTAPPDDPPNPRLVGFNERRRTNSFGHYVTPEMLAKLRPQHASEALRELPGVITRPAMKSIGNIVRLRGCGVRGQSAEKVGPLVWLDGVRLVGAEIDEVTQGMDIAAIEVYNSFAGIPAQYLDRSAVCGTILVWTKTR
jgi:Carboxypeptidase regulatory-like domain